MKKLVVQAGLIVGLALAVAGLDGAVRGLKMPDRPTSERPAILDQLRQRSAEGIPQRAPDDLDAAAPADFAVQDTGGFSAFDVELLISEGLAIPIDARTQAEFRKGHLPTAMHLTLEAFAGGAMPDEIMMLSDIQAAVPDMTLVVYCDGGDCHASDAVGAKLMEFGLQNVYVFEGGYPEWTAAGLPIEEGGSMYQ